MIKFFNRHRNVILFLTILLLGGIFRWVLMSVTPHDLYWDENSYIALSKLVSAGKLGADCCDKNMGYPFFLSALFFLFRVTNTYTVWASQVNLSAVWYSQLFLDLVLAILLYFTAQVLFNRKTAWVVYLIYIFNPLTSSFITILLPEIVSMFLIACIALILARKSFVKKDSTWMIFGFVLGMLVFLRYSLFPMAVCMTAGMAFFLFKRKIKIIFFVIVLFGFLVASSYSLTANYVNFKRISLVPPYVRGLMMSLYLSFYENRYPELAADVGNFDPTFYRINVEYRQTYYPYLDALQAKYPKLFWDKFSKEWPTFFKNTVRNMFWIWDKEHLSIYADPFYPADKWAVRIYDIVLIILFFIGIGIFAIKQRKLLHPLVIFSAGMFFYITLVFTPVSNESRHSMVFYPLIFLWAGYGLVRVIDKIRVFKFSK